MALFTQNVVYGSAILVTFGCSLENQNLRHHPTLAESKSAFFTRCPDVSYEH